MQRAASSNMRTCAAQKRTHACAQRFKKREGDLLGRDRCFILWRGWLAEQQQRTRLAKGSRASRARSWATNIRCRGKDTLLRPEPPPPAAQGQGRVFQETTCRFLKYDVVLP